MKKHYTLRAIALVSVSVLPLTAAIAADDAGQKVSENWLQVGGRWQSQDNNPFWGRYNGLATGSGGEAGGSFNLLSKDAWDSGKTEYFQFWGNNIDFSTKHYAPEVMVAGKYGIQGQWGVSATYDAITYTGNTIQSAFINTGNNASLVAGLTPYGGAAIAGPGTTLTSTYYLSNPAGIAALSSALMPTRTETRRDAVTGTGNFRMGDWTFAANLRHEHKEGTMEQTYYAGISGQAFAQPIDFDTERYSMTASYATKRLQAMLGYTYSSFSDGYTSWNAPYFFSPTAAPFQLGAAYGLPPNNSAHTFTGTGGYNLTSNTRITGNFRVGLELQNNALVPFSSTTPAQMNNPATYSVLAMNPAGLNGQATVYGGNIQVTSTPIQYLDLRAAYNIDSRDNQTNMYQVWGNGHPEGTVTAANYYTAFPQNWTKQNAQVEAGYKILPSSNTKVTVGYAYDDVDRSFATVGRSNESTFSAKVSSAPWTGVDGSLAYEHGNRNGQVHYWMPWAMLNAGLNNGTPALNSSYPSVPYYQAPRVSDSMKLRGNYMPNDSMSLGLFGRFTNNAYKYPGTTPWTSVQVAGTTAPVAGGWDGTTRDQNVTAGPDFTYTPSKNLTSHLFYTFERVFYENHGNGVQPVFPVTAPPASGRWSAATTDDIHTVGLSAEWKASDKLKLGTGYTFYYGNVSYVLFNGVQVASPTASYQNVAPMPDIPASMHSFKVFGEYALSDAMTLGVGYGFDMFKDNDWAYSWAPVTQTSATSGTMTTGVAAPSYRVHSLASTLRVKF
ncbi:MAG TPA: MtrB/PioB family outer membrane beta-barrel protein [Rhodospirillaceae bacterium]|nr:MtrB/PioB family outer membrane beta-barrel protein [Rhodospirillaceae bacterium]